MELRQTDRELRRRRFRKSEINQNPYSSRFARPGRARLEIITKGGTPAYHGSDEFLFRDAVFLTQKYFCGREAAGTEAVLRGLIDWADRREQEDFVSLVAGMGQDNNQAAVVANWPKQRAINANVPQAMRHFFGSGGLSHFTTEITSGSDILFEHQKQQ